jgi:hypothetical protein
MKPTAEEIDDRIRSILVEHGPDGHIDGHEELTAYVVGLLQGGGKLLKMLLPDIGGLEQFPSEREGYLSSQRLHDPDPREAALRQFRQWLEKEAAEWKDCAEDFPSDTATARYCAGNHGATSRILREFDRLLGETREEQP